MVAGAAVVLVVVALGVVVAGAAVVALGVVVAGAVVVLVLAAASAGLAGASTETVSNHERIAHRPSCATMPSNFGM